MSRTATAILPPPPVRVSDALAIFEPADYSMQELAFLKLNLRKSPNVALHGFRRQIGVNPVAIRTALAQFHELEELQREASVPWAGYETIEDSIDRFVAWQELSLNIQASGGPRHPSMKVWDSLGTMSHAGIGSDSCDKVRTEILEDGQRRRFAVQLRGNSEGSAAYMPWTRSGRGAEQLKADATVYDDRAGSAACGVCGVVVTTYKPGSSRAKNLAMRKVQSHLRQSRTEPARHRAVLKREF